MEDEKCVVPLKILANGYGMILISFSMLLIHNEEKDNMKLPLKEGGKT